MECDRGKLKSADYYRLDSTHIITKVSRGSGTLRSSIVSLAYYNSQGKLERQITYPISTIDIKHDVHYDDSGDIVQDQTIDKFLVYNLDTDTWSI